MTTKTSNQKADMMRCNIVRLMHWIGKVKK